MTPLHLGPLHTVEWVMFLALLLGPVLALGATILVVRRRDEREAALEADGDPSSTGAPPADASPYLPVPRTPTHRSRPC